MRYIYYILAILVLSSVLAAAYLVAGRKPPEKAAVVINERVITPEEFDRRAASGEQGRKSRAEFINDLVTREILIQEARKQGIDREEPFRQSIQSFYEQSLIKILIDRKLETIRAEVTDEEVRRFLNLCGCRVHLTLFFGRTAGEAARSDKDGESRAVLFEDLSREMREIVESLKPGERSGPVPMSGQFATVRLDRIEPVHRKLPSSLEIEKARDLLVREKKERILDEWVDSLRKGASVRVLVPEK